MVEYRDHESQPLMSDPEQRDEQVDGQRRRGQEATANDSDAAGHPDAPLGEEHQHQHQQQPDDNERSHGQGADTLELDEDSDPPTPRFVQDEHAWKRWKWVPYPARRFVKAVGRWALGPVNAQPYRIKPLLPAVQEYPLWLVDRFLPTAKRRAWVLFLYFSIWIITFVLVKRQGTLVTDIPGWGEPQDIGCGATYWSAGNACGIDGSECRPFSGSGFAFRCSGNCASYQALNPRAVGDTEVIYQPLIVGGPASDATMENATYRGDSYICGSAIHAGAINNADGGCGVVQLVGSSQNYLSSKRNGLTSVAFDSYFPLSFQFLGGIKCEYHDTRWATLAVSVVFTSVLSLFTASSALFFFPVFIMIFWTVGMALDPPPSTSVADLFSNILAKFLPAMFCAWVMYDKMGVRRTLKGLTAQIEKTVLWLGACWVGALDNYTLDFIPIQRLSKHDLDQQPGAKAALSIIVILLVIIVATQVWFFRQEARFVKYIKLYALFVGGIIISLVLPGLNLRIHHFILALLLLPGTSMQTRPCLLYQGLLIGLFINGIARWGWGSFLETSAALQGDAQKGSPLPVVHEPIIATSNSTGGTSNITFTWDPTPSLKQWDGISILVNDVERFRSYFSDSDARSEFAWPRNNTVKLPEYFRFAFMDGSDSGDYTKAGQWTEDKEWVTMKPGPSKVKRRSLDEFERLPR